MSEKLMYAVTDAVVTTSLGRTTIYQKIRSGELETVKVGNRRLITAESLHAFVDRLKAGAE